MEKRQNPKRFWKKATLVFAVAVSFLLPMSAASANSAPPLRPSQTVGQP
jgi:hypothetical protein